MSAVWSIAKAEMVWLSRSRLAQISAGIFLLLLALSVLTSTVFLSEQFDHRQTHQDEATDIFEDQPDRHPHRMVHYGQYVFRTPPPLASIDPGLDAYGGTSIFLEGHRQNAAMFAGASEGAAMVRFGNLTPAFILQVLAPLLLILIGHSGITRERESSTLRVLLAQGVKLRSIALGKLSVQLIICAACVLVLAGAALTAGPAETRDSASATAVVLVYAVYLAIWALAVTSISTMLRRSSSAFLVLAALWMIVTIVVPRVAADVASTAAPLESAFARQMALATSLRALGDSHNPSDPNYVDFQSQVLADYGVETLDELPVNIRGLMAVEGERQGAEVLARFSGEDQGARLRQQ
ncbi:ABC transporter permease subunit, partial [Congregibacter sp.]|uniref:ABC transporter permease subunit n=1 Tax=Congregibacter sp. TaxID=2744308 RepID=UPI0038584CFD